MPDQHPLKRQPKLPLETESSRLTNAHRGAIAREITLEPRYAELHCRSNFSFLEGASHPDELVQQAAQLGLEALAITDRNSLAGVVRAHVAAKLAKLKLLIGAEITPEDAPPLLLWVMNRSGYGHLCRLITRGRQQAPKGRCRLMLRDVLEHSAGLLVGVPLAWLVQQTCLSAENTTAFRQLREAYGDRLYGLVERHLGPQDRLVLHRQQVVSAAFNIPLIAANDIHYHQPERQRLQDVLTAIRHGCSVEELGTRCFPNAERHLKSPTQMAALFRDAPELVTHTIVVAERCSFSLDELRYDYPVELCPPGMTPLAYLTQLTWAGAQDRYPNGVPEKVQKLLEYELRLIGELNYPAYFLSVWDLVSFARSRGILCQGRGSAANSAVCYCLGVTSVDPDRIDTLFERFISKERNEAPDIDVDFEHARREEVIQYLYQKYGRERAAMTAAVISYCPRSAIRDVGKALGLSLDRVNLLNQHVGHLHDRAELESRFREAGLPPESRLGQLLSGLVIELLGFPRHLSQHTGGMVLTNSPLCELVPIENASMPGRTVVEWDKDDLDALGILKVDVLALGMLTAIRKCFDLIMRHYHRDLTLALIPADDYRVFDMIGRADTIGVFQIESRAQMAMLPRLKPRCFYDLVVEVAIVRPGPIQGGMVHPYLRRRCGEEPIDSPDERIRSILDKTLGVPIFQEQAMRLAIVAAGFTPGEADQLRRAMGAWRKPGLISQFQQKLIHGMTANGYTAEFAQRVFQQLQGFGEYGFPESHSCAFALLVWASAWLKYHYPAAFTASLLNSLPMGFYAPAQLVADARKHGVKVLPIDVNFSEWNCTLEQTQIDDQHALRLGLRMVTGLSLQDAESIMTARNSQPFNSMADFFRRTRVRNSVATCLSRADGFRSLQLNRRDSLWQALPQAADVGSLLNHPRSQQGDLTEFHPELPQRSALEEVIADYRTIGLSLRDHPMKFLRQRLQERRVVSTWELAAWPNGKCVSVAGLVLMRQRPGTAKGITFVTVEDETGIANLIVHPEVWERYRHVARAATAVLVTGSLQREGQVIHVLVNHFCDLSIEIADLQMRSRDFH